MQRHHSATNVTKSLALWMLGQALPEPTALAHPAKLAGRGVTAAVIAGVMLSVGAGALLAGLYMFLMSEGLRPSVSLSIVSGIAILCSITAWLVARNSFHRSVHEVGSLGLFSDIQTDTIGTACKSVVEGFLEGWREKSQQAAVQEQLAEVEREIERHERAMELLHQHELEKHRDHRFHVM